MRSALPTYPVDRYLVRGGKRIEKVNINDDDLWTVEPGLKPEDDIMLSKLQGMLQSTAEELKTISEEMSKYHEPGGVQVKVLPMPLDQAFNEKVHIEQVVNAKFLGQKIIDPKQVNEKKLNSNNPINKKVTNTSVQVNTISSISKKGQEKRTNLSLSKTRVVYIPGISKEIGTKENKNVIRKNENFNSVAYNEFTFKENTESSPKLFRNLQIQELPSINIRSELKQQKVFNFDIAPEKTLHGSNESEQNSNVAVVEVNTVPGLQTTKANASTDQTKYHQPTRSTKRQSRKILKLSTYESSESTEQVNSDVQNRWSPQKSYKRNIVRTARANTRSKSNNLVVDKQKPLRSSLINAAPETKKTLNSGYSKLAANHKLKVGNKDSLLTRPLNNRDYVPYSKLTLGGVDLKQIERTQKSLALEDVPLSSIINTIISQENKSSDEDSQKASPNPSLPILSASDDHRLQDVEETKSLKQNKKSNTANNEKKSKEKDSSSEKKYDDDFEDPAATDISGNSANLESEPGSPAADGIDTHATANAPAKDTTFTRTSNLTFKNTVDVIEFIHSIDRQDSATQSNLPQNRVTEAQTSPPCGTASIQPIHNDLWPLDTETELDCVKDISKMFKLEKEFIKKLIIEEYGDVLRKGVDNSSKPSSSKNDTTSQKNTQTSPARVKSVMTSTKKLKTRTTSPFCLNRTLDRHTSPILFSQRRSSSDQIHNDSPIHINLSSQSINLDLPHNSRETLPNLQSCNPQKDTGIKMGAKAQTQQYSSSSTSVDADLSSSELSSLGEIKLKLKRKDVNEMQFALSSASTSSFTSSSHSQTSFVLPTKSDGEISMRLNNS